MRMLLPYLVFGPLLAAVVCLFNLPLMSALRLSRGRVHRTFAPAVLSASFAVTTAWLLWTLEWTDVYRLGMPSFGYLFRTMLVYVIGLAIAGWFIGRRIGRRTRLTHYTPIDTASA